MVFDLRLAIGVLFLCCGLILLSHGLIVGTQVLGLNVNLWWGAAMVAFGTIMAYLGRSPRS